MKILHIDSGLGNQMLGFCEFLAMQQSNPDDLCCIETLVYEINECDATISQWNGYELERVFGIHVPNLKDIIGKEKYEIIRRDMVESQFWEKNWNFSPYLTESLHNVGIDVINNCYIKDENEHMLHSSLIDFIRNNGYDILKYCLALYRQRIDPEQYVRRFDDRKTLFFTSDQNVLSGQRFSFIHKGNDIERIDNLIRRSFVFPPIVDDANLKLLDRLQNGPSVAIHVRRGDMLSRTDVYYKGGYFKRAVHYIKEHVEHPEFYLFSDPDSCKWSLENLAVFGLNSKDNVTCIDWNKGLESFRDMQLMSQCKHNIVTNSSFGWWGAYLNNNPHKITTSPDYSYNTTHHF